MHVEGFGGVRVRRVTSGGERVYAIGEDGELFSWGHGVYWQLGHGDQQDQPSPKRVEALRGVRVRHVSAGYAHALALAEDGLVYMWGRTQVQATLGNTHAERELPKPVEALRGVRISSVVVGFHRSYALGETGKVWALEHVEPRRHGEQVDCAVPKPMEALRGIKVDAVVEGSEYTLALADDWKVYARGSLAAAMPGALSLDLSVGETRARSGRRSASRRCAWR
jgi:alpha-tubulin suppressor-like RCC1 family protein